jgi:hypothetical protein
MTTLRTLENCLEREMPLFHWHCEPARDSKFLPNTEIPEDIIVTAEHEGRRIDGTPHHVNGRMLERWGFDTTARLVWNEFVKSQSRATRPMEWSWDKLADY